MSNTHAAAAAGATGATGRPPSEKTLFGHPRALYVLFFAELWERFSYYGMRALLTLYMMDYLMFSGAKAGGVYGDYTGLVYLTPLLGGFIADRYLGLRRSVILGGLLMALGHALMAVDDKGTPGNPFLYSALLCLILGNGFFKPNISTLVGKLYKQGDPRRDGGFTIFYMGINVGAFLAPLGCGWIGQKTWGEVREYGFFRALEPVIRTILGGDPLTDETQLWHLGFGLATIGMLLGLVVFWFGAKAFLGDIGIQPARLTDQAERPKESQGDRPATGSGLGAIAIVAVLGLAYAAWRAWQVLHPAAGEPAGTLDAVRATLWPIAGTIALSILAFLMARCQGTERTRVGAIFLIGVFVMIFWGAFEQAGSSLTLFADRNTRLNVGSWDFESSMFQSVNPFCIIAFAPVFSAVWTWLALRGKDPSTPVKMLLGVMLECCAFALLIPAAKLAADGRISPVWLTAAYFLQTCGELCISPVGLSMVTKLAPARFGAMLMGVWFLSNAFANKLAGIGGAMIGEVGPTSLFTFITVVLAAAALVLVFLIPMLRRWMGGVR